MHSEGGGRRSPELGAGALGKNLKIEAPNIPAISARDAPLDGNRVVRSRDSGDM